MKTTRIFTELPLAAEMIVNGQLVAVPTETVYGLAGNGLNEEAVRQIYEVKGRPEIKPLSLMVPGSEAIEQYCFDVPEAAKALAERFWPGPLTIVLKARELVPPVVRAGGDTVGLRCPDHPLTLETLRLAGVPFAAPSANPSGAASPKTADEVLHYFDGKISAVIDGGPCGIGRESTLLDISRKPYRILRQGALSEKEIADALAEKLVKIGITGGTGSGKSTALQELEKRGALILDCDKVYHELLENSQPLISELQACFPAAVRDGHVDRKALGAIVFSDADLLKKLNEITHRHIGIAIQERLRQWAMQGGTLVAFDAIELIGSGLGAQCKATIGVLADEEVRVERIVKRDGISREYALLRIRAQQPDSYFENNCSCVIHNNGDLDSFIQEFNKIMEDILNHG